jgi:hypothetical protein
VSSRVFHWVAENELLGIVEGSDPSEIKEEAAHFARAGNQGAQTTLGSVTHIDQKKDDGSKPGLTGTYQGTTWNKQP